MSGLKKNYIKKGHQTDKQTNPQTFEHTSGILDQLGPEGRVGENLFLLDGLDRRILQDDSLVRHCLGLNQMNFPRRHKYTNHYLEVQTFPKSQLNQTRPKLKAHII